MAGNVLATDADIVLLYPSLALAPPDGLAVVTRDLLRECAECEFNTCVWGCHLRMGHLHYSAFLMEVAVDNQRAATTPSGAPQVVGALASVTEGPQSASFHAPAPLTDPADSFLQTKRSGQQYLLLRDGLGPVPLVLASGGCVPGTNNLTPCS